RDWEAADGEAPGAAGAPAALDRLQSLITSCECAYGSTWAAAIFAVGISKAEKMNKAFAAAAAAALVLVSVSPPLGPGPCLPATFWACMAIPNPPPPAATAPAAPRPAPAPPPDAPAPPP